MNETKNKGKENDQACGGCTVTACYRTNSEDCYLNCPADPAFINFEYDEKTLDYFRATLEIGPLYE
ncbi:MAG: hypothetical protein NT178_17140 [Proteobacteria bacterium]|nr:hypothetical protein [Pseudomonadota bacterium]